MKRTVSIAPYMKIKVGERTAGTIHLLGAEPGDEGVFIMLVRSTGVIHAFTCHCEGAFNSVDRLVDMDGDAGTTFIGKKFIGRNPMHMSAAEKLEFMKGFAEYLARRVAPYMKQVD